MEGQRLVSCECLSRAMSEIWKCSACRSTLTLREELVSRRELVSKLVICCTNSVCSKEAVVCDPYSSESKLRNTRSIMEMRQIGRGRAGLESFCGYMDMLPPVTAASYKIHNAHIAVASMEAAEANMQAASQNLHRKFGVQPSALKDVTVTCDGTWSKRGFTATYGGGGGNRMVYWENPGLRDPQQALYTLCKQTQDNGC